MSEWELDDYRHPIEALDDAPREIIRSEEQLRSRLHTLKDDGEQGVFILSSPENECLQIGIGPTFGFLHWKNIAMGYGGSAMASREDATEEEYFLFEGITKEIDPEELLPVDDVIEAAVYFFANGNLSTKFSWEIWNPNTKKWEVRQEKAE